MPFGQGVGATKLADGSVLVIGERPPGSTATIYDPATKQFKPTGSLNVARGYSSLTLLSDGKVLVAGGQEQVEGGPQTLAVAEVYDPSTGDFTVTARLNEHRAGHAAVLLPGGKVLIVGGIQTTTPGFGNSLDIAELYDPATGDFSAVGKMALRRSGLYSGVVLLNDGKVLVAGGAFAEIYDPATNTFSRTEDMLTNHSSHTSTLLPDGRVLVAGGVLNPEVELYDPVTGSFSSPF